MRINPTVACADLLNLKRDIDTLISVGIEIIHIDIMDGHYVPNLCFSFDAVDQIRREYPGLKLDVHLMTDSPLESAKRLLTARPDYITFHPDAAGSSAQLIDFLHENGIGAGIAVKPGQSIDEYQHLYPVCDMVLLMAVEPGFSGQKFIESTYDKISSLNGLRKCVGASFLIQVDGGVSLGNAPGCFRCGADLVVAGALAIFGQTDSLRDCCMRMLDEASFWL